MIANPITNPALLAQLAQAIPLLGQNDKGFALSLHDYHVKHGHWSEKQDMWAKKMVDKANVGKKGPPAAESVPSPVPEPPKVMEQEAFKAICDLLDKAGQHLKHPSVVLPYQLKAPDGMLLNKTMVLKKKLGYINIVSSNAYPNKYWGKITETGAFVPKFGLNTPLVEAISASLKEFAADPAGVAAKFGKLHGKCCFCHKGLTDPKSTSVGYGPVCAMHYGLPWGDVSVGQWKAVSGKVLGDGIVVGGVVTGGIATPPKAEVTVTLHTSSALKKPSGALLDELKEEAQHATKVSVVEKIVPVLDVETWERLKNPVVIF